MKDIKWQHVDLCVPEHVSPICLSGQATRTDRNMLVGWIGRCDQVIDRKPERALSFFVSGNPDFGVLPIDDAMRRHALPRPFESHASPSR